ncbi:hypothetical protein FIA58_004615 [Flavobacterium jejuense]|uniref:Histidine kinase/HSP90-like ATPase domain-containing protein n=1 Tax=Flavobacterium jejuense TaxID=1544455 RepID=A0ABX0ISW2_9FLAO|nr:hypothetical protein [Flavobacterium jejuense]NHN24954.1 hypothetical protein [Flavobacterium jejuense]
MQKIPKTLTVEKINELYNELYRDTKTFDLLLPNSISSYDFGISSLLIQYINTWLRLRSGNLIIETKEDYSDLQDVINQDYVFPCVIMAWDNGIFDLKGNDIKHLIKPINEEIADSMQSLENFPLMNKEFKQQKGFKSLLTCFDHLPKEKGYLDCFYLNNSFIPSDEYLMNSLEDTLNYVLTFNQSAREKLLPIKKDLVSIIFELMKNTHDWARTDNNSKMLNPNNRGLLMKFVKKTKENYIENYKNHNGLKSYFDSFSTNLKDELYFIEISVFDSGIGYVNRFTSSDALPNIDEQINIVKDCLIKHNTSDKTIEKENKGIGLDKIMTVLDKKGVFILKTNNVFVFRNMKKNPYVQTQNKYEIELFDYYTFESNHFTYNHKSVGTSFTIVYPITLS